MKDALENLLKGQSFRLVHWLSTTLSLRKSSQESVNLERKSYLDCSLDTLCTREEFGREIYSKRLNAKEVINHKKMENSFFQSQMDESNLLEEFRN